MSATMFPTTGQATTGNKRRWASGLRAAESVTSHDGAGNRLLSPVLAALAVDPREERIVTRAMPKLTEKQWQRLRVVGGATIVLIPDKRDWEPLLRRGLVEPVPVKSLDAVPATCLPSLRITAAGYHALAEGLSEDRKPVFSREDAS